MSEDTTAPSLENPSPTATETPPASPNADLRKALIDLCCAIAEGRGRQVAPAILAGLGVPPPPERK